MDAMQHGSPSSRVRGEGVLRPDAERGARRAAVVSACPFGAAVCADWARRQAGLCLECWAGVLERANAQSEWLRGS